MTANEEYWQERTAALESKWFDKCRSEIEKELARYYRSASQHIQDDIAALYARFAQENKMTFTAARKLIQGDEFSVWRMDIREYLESIDNELSETKKKRLLKELNTLAMRSRINVLEKLHGETLMELAKLATLTERDMTDFFRRCYSDTYYRDLFAIGQKIGIDPDRARMNNEWLEKVLAAPWSGKNYSQRIWDNQQKLAQVIKETVLNGIHRGLSVPKLSEEVSRRMEVGKSQAVRLVRTEMNYVQNQANLDSIKSSGLKYYRFCATLDKRTSAQCRAKDGKIFPVDEAKAGSNLPPLHPHCRSTVVASLKAEDRTKGQRISRYDNGSIAYVPAGIEYKDWMRVFVNGEISIDKWRIERGITRVTKVKLLGKPNSVTEYVVKKGGIDRNFYDENGRQYKQISNHDHGNRKNHPYGENGEHAHDYQVDSNGRLTNRNERNLTEQEKRDNGDFL